MIEPDHPQLLITRQCALVGISWSAFYGGLRTESLETLAIMRAIDGQFLETLWSGSQQMVRHLRRRGHEVGHKRVRCLMARMGLAAIYQRPKTTVRHPKHRVFPYPLRTMAIEEPDQSGAPTSPTYRCDAASCTWSPSWAGTAAGFCPGG